jgi:hypothetical protein
MTDAWSLTPEEASANLATMTAAYKATQPVSPQAKLSEFYADKENRAKLDAGDPATRQQFDELSRAAAVVDDPVKAAMAGHLPALPSSELRQLESGANWLRGIGLKDDTIADFLSGKPLPQSFKDQIKAGEQRLLQDRDWTQKWLSGDAACREQMALAKMVNIVPTAEENA